MRKSVLDYILRIYLPVTLLIVVVTYTVTYFVSRDERYHVGYQPTQPINYSHELHAGQLAIDCQYCHTGASKGRHANVPAVETCMNCHTVARTDRPEIKKLTAFYKENKPIPWQRIHKLPEHVYFNHSVHVNKGLACQECHGQIQTMPVVAQAKPFMMADCLACHRTAPQKYPHLVNLTGLKKGPENCTACHR
ncbi:cytochrome C [bacterium (Candidatus Blackallbacteria) CG17_big_fil_post_rev_8_21_14_2_50_48_46]|uniref:Cytochrome C n=1 Tax=bacterium (Candidatus Blackallbacteria) CG17_big_fil_post_rev_8_21_14_2_50_48_46 TaxID=2014261 RepID=A0A2M7G5H3_9BACT|nr:MAG: cytochrome C [bacterium (Candidatus Blackallbacteria) CG18_big_fil_WC_8_21_14_2_50_49_26]PIW17072.1 MAG: cytochrome C [bacterium (Candidatus Blackallbacteria) CG17_big_fil_post_rev_8_21_14_2_50_48_46]PIW47693.1 MAG: cytochrome C [bacterium (Candidatus Blackallbacteria) CG13_big_fil_rev_8_21_14_2_50_49_14]